MRAETEILLEYWGQWSRCDRSIGKITSCIEIYCEYHLGSTVKMPMISDDKARVVESAVLSLMSNDARAADVICLYYVRQKKIYQIEKMRGITYGSANKLLSYGHGFIDAALTFGDDDEAAA
ncbi:MAG: hypothetical protein KTR20_12770 [Cellvibrionaceae bacterium]|nr:hypothetical protein [Cellvibrionaceae bacterium]